MFKLLIVSSCMPVVIFSKINLRVSKTSNNKTMLLSKCDISSTKSSRFIKKQEASGLLNSLGLKTPYGKIHYFVIFCFKYNSYICN